MADASDPGSAYRLVHRQFSLSAATVESRTEVALMDVRRRRLLPLDKFCRIEPRTIASDIRSAARISYQEELTGAVA